MTSGQGTSRPSKASRLRQGQPTPFTPQRATERRLVDGVQGNLCFVSTFKLFETKQICDTPTHSLPILDQQTIARARSAQARRAAEGRASPPPLPNIDSGHCNRASIGGKGNLFCIHSIPINHSSPILDQGAKRLSKASRRRLLASSSSSYE